MPRTSSSGAQPQFRAGFRSWEGGQWSAWCWVPACVRQAQLLPSCTSSGTSDLAVLKVRRPKAAVHRAALLGLQDGSYFLPRGHLDFWAQGLFLCLRSQHLRIPVPLRALRPSSHLLRPWPSTVSPSRSTSFPHSHPQGPFCHARGRRRSQGLRCGPSLLSVWTPAHSQSVGRQPIGPNNPFEIHPSRVLKSHLTRVRNL